MRDHDSPNLLWCARCEVHVRFPPRAPFWRVPCCPRCKGVLLERLPDPYALGYCVLCGTSDPRRDRRLLNGAVFHEDCVRRVEDLIARFRGEHADAERRLHQGWLGRLAARLAGRRVNNEAELREELRNLERSIAYLSHLRDAYYELWPTYPPDWLLRREQALARARHRCERCGSACGPLQLHHRLPRHRGGTHRLENLVVLCERCHRRQHTHEIGHTETWNAPPPAEYIDKVELSRVPCRRGGSCTSTTAAGTASAASGPSGPRRSSPLGSRSASRASATYARRSGTSTSGVCPDLSSSRVPDVAGTCPDQARPRAWTPAP